VIRIVAGPSAAAPPAALIGGACVPQPGERIDLIAIGIFLHQLRQPEIFARNDTWWAEQVS